MEQKGMRYNVAPYLFPGWLSDELVIGMGRSMKLTSMLVKVTAYRISDERNSSRATHGPPRYLVGMVDSRRISRRQAYPAHWGRGEDLSMDIRGSREV